MHPLPGSLPSVILILSVVSSPAFHARAEPLIVRSPAGNFQKPN